MFFRQRVCIFVLHILDNISRLTSVFQSWKTWNHRAVEMFTSNWVLTVGQKIFLNTRRVHGTTAGTWGHALKNCGYLGLFGTLKNGRWFCTVMILTIWGTWVQRSTLETGVTERKQMQKMQEDISDKKLIFFPSYFFVRDRRQELSRPASPCYILPPKGQLAIAGWCFPSHSWKSMFQFLSALELSVQMHTRYYVYNHKIKALPTVWDRFRGTEKVPPCMWRFVAGPVLIPAPFLIRKRFIRTRWSRDSEQGSQFCELW